MVMPDASRPDPIQDDLDAEADMAFLQNAVATLRGRGMSYEDILTAIGRMAGPDDSAQVRIRSAPQPRSWRR